MLSGQLRVAASWSRAGVEGQLKVERLKRQREMRMRMHGQLRTTEQRGCSGLRTHAKPRYSAMLFTLVLRSANATRTSVLVSQGPMPSTGLEVLGPAQGAVPHEGMHPLGSWRAERGWPGSMPCLDTHGLKLPATAWRQSNAWTSTA